MTYSTSKSFHKRYYLLFIGLFFSFTEIAFAQIPRQFLDISVSPSKADWVYQIGEEVEFIVSITQSGRPVAVENVRYFVKEEKMPSTQEGPLSLNKGKATISASGMKVPGFLRCEVFATIDGKEYRGLGTAAFEPEKIQPTVKMPEDFEAFWNSGKAIWLKSPWKQKWFIFLSEAQMQWTCTMSTFEMLETAGFMAC